MILCLNHSWGIGGFRITKKGPSCGSSCTKHKSTFMNAFNQRQQEHEEPGAASSSSHVLNSLWFPEFTSASSKFLCAPLHQHRKREAVCMVSNNKDEKIHANHRESGNVSLMRKNLQLMEQNSSFLLLIWKFQFLLSLKIYFKKITTPFISMLLKLLFKMLTHTQGVPAPSAQRGKHLIN